MKIAIFSILALFLAVAGAVKSAQQSIIVTFPANTPSHVLDKAMDVIVSAGGIITHEYTLLRGFAANAPAKVIETVTAWGAEFNAVVELDQMVSVQG